MTPRLWDICQAKGLHDRVTRQRLALCAGTNFRIGHLDWNTNSATTVKSETSVEQAFVNKIKSQ